MPVHWDWEWHCRLLMTPCCAAAADLALSTLVPVIAE
jgi:hypothetical protein